MKSALVLILMALAAYPVGGYKKPCPTVLAIDESLAARLGASPYTKNLKLTPEFSKKIVEFLGGKVWSDADQAIDLATKATLSAINRHDLMVNPSVFSNIKRVLKKWYDENWNHALVVAPDVERFAGQDYESEYKYVLTYPELLMWVRGEGPHKDKNHVFGRIPITNFNRTQVSISVHLDGFDGETIYYWDLVKDIRSKGFNIKGAPDTVPVSNGRFATFDHRRLTAARDAGNVDEIISKVHRPNSRVPDRLFSKSMQIRFIGNVPIKITLADGTRMEVFRGYEPKTWGEALQCACANAAAKSGRFFPPEGEPGLPRSPR